MLSMDPLLTLVVAGKWIIKREVTFVVSNTASPYAVYKYISPHANSLKWMKKEEEIGLQCFISEERKKRGKIERKQATKVSDYKAEATAYVIQTECN